MPKIVAIGHQKNVGKDQFVKFCIDILRGSSNFKRIERRGFADNLYDICYILYAWAGFRPRIYYQENPSAKNDLLAINKTVRDVLIEVGNKLREFDADVWINSALRGLQFDVLFITDLRYPNEFLHCKSVNALTVRMTRPNLPVPTDDADTALNGHYEWDVGFDNNGSLNDLYTFAESFVKAHILE